MRALLGLLLLLPSVTSAAARGPGVERFVPVTYDMSLTRVSAPGKLHDPNLSLWPNLPLYPGLTSLGVRVRWDGHTLREAGGRFRDEEAWVVPPPAGYSSVARLTIAPLPVTYIFDGHRYGIYDPTARTVAIYRDDVSWPETEGFLRQFVAYKTIAALDRALSPCRSFKRRGTAHVAGRLAYVIALGPVHCRPPPDAHRYDRLLDGRTIVWIDAATFFSLREDQYAFGHPHQLVLRTTVQSIQYNLSLPAALFQVTVPPGYTVTHNG